ncbi:uncharacterized protein LOC133205102 [Saccostrea echinata]|uniref:uncharacterized protein LOC133205102 n=1 Tax=Saccostrea echinata TaxID=191078 RepID=UPI002A815D6C|nr:uncharacterized protein LOC133205102 [Saccostrea echinata]
MDLFWKRVSVGICVLASALLYIPILFYYGVIEIHNPKLGNITGYQCYKLPGTPDQLKGLKVFQGVGFFITICNVVVISALYIIITVSIVKQVRKMKSIHVKPAESSGMSSDATAMSDVSKPQKFTSVATESSEVLETSVNSVSQLEPRKQKKTPKSDAKRNAFRVSFMFMTISFVGFLAYLPSWSFIVIETNNPTFWKKLSTTALHVCLTLRRMYMLNHFANPFIYGVFDVAFRQEIRKLFCVK